MCPLATSLTSPPLCLNAERSRIPAHLKQVLFQGNQGAGPERSCSQPPLHRHRSGPDAGGRRACKEFSGPAHRSREIKVGEPPGVLPRQLSPCKEDEQGPGEGWAGRLRCSYRSNIFLKDRRQKITFHPSSQTFLKPLSLDPRKPS